MTSKLPPPGALVIVAAAAQRSMSAPMRPMSPVRRASSTALVTASLAFLATSVREFHRSKTTVNPMTPGDASTLVVAGPHRLSRNPMYLGMVGLLCGHAVAIGRRRAMLPALAFVAVVDRLQIPSEESALRARFGREYDAYCARVPRWVGLPT